jgi:hypothetical protein
VIVVIPVAFTPRATITFGRIAAAAPAADSHDAHVVVGSRSDPQEASPFRLHATGCRSSGTNVIVSAIIRF